MSAQKLKETRTFKYRKFNADDRAAFYTRAAALHTAGNTYKQIARMMNGESYRQPDGAWITSQYIARNMPTVRKFMGAETKETTATVTPIRKSKTTNVEKKALADLVFAADCLDKKTKLQLLEALL